MGYKGKATIDFTVERIPDADGKYRLVKDDDDERSVEGMELEIKGQSYYQEGRFYGAPEDCYDNEGETEILSITFNGKPWDGELTEDEIACAESDIALAVQEDNEYDPPSQRDSGPMSRDYADSVF